MDSGGRPVDAVLKPENFLKQLATPLSKRPAIPLFKRYAT
jgi:hypothetical protein